MGQRIKKIFIIMLSVGVLLSTLPMGTVQAAESDFVIVDGVLTDYIGPGGDVVIPEGVTEIGRSVFSNNRTIMSVTLPSSIDVIGEDAFRDCRNLTSVFIPEGLSYIGIFAFESCTSLASITLPEGLKTIGNSAFGYCTSLTSITLPESLNGIGNLAFANCTNLSTINMPEDLNSIGLGTFSGCRSLENIIVPNNIQIITTDLFKNCNSLTSVIIPNSVTSIQASAFEGCSSLEEISIPKDVIHIDDNAFAYCGKLSNIVLPDKISIIHSNTFFSCTSLTDVVLPSNLTKIESFAFGYCEKLSNLVLPSSVETIGQFVFCGCDSLTTFVIPYGITNIEAFTFADCDKLDSIIIPDTVDFIDSYAFSNCVALENITLPSSISTIYGHTFYNCSSLKTINFPNNISSIGEFAFFGCSSLEEIILPSTITEIAPSTFSNCTLLQKVVLPDDLLIINGFAFARCYNLEEITISEKVTTIIGNSFYNCTNLRYVELPKSVTNIGIDAFQNCPNLNIYCFSDSYAETYAIDNEINYYLLPLSIQYISLDTLPAKTVYEPNEAIQVEGCTIVVTYIDSSTKDVDVTLDMISGYDALKLGIQTITITYEGETTTFDVTVREPILVNSININSGSATVVKAQTLQMSTGILPADADDQSITWSVINVTGSAMIDQNGLLSATGVGTVTVLATANDGSGVYGEKEITVESIKVSLITVNSGSDTVLKTETLQMSTDILPLDSDDQTVTWSVIGGTGSATIDQNGLLTGTGIGNVTVRATANDGSGVYGEEEIIVEPLKVSSITVNSDSDTVARAQTLQMSADILPVEATDQSVIWSVINGTGSASINQDGLLIPSDIGTVIVRATANDGSGVYGQKTISVITVSAPQVSIMGYTGKIKLTWDSCDGATKYKIYSYDGSYHYVGSTTSTSYIVSELSNGEEYTFLVRAYNEYGGSAYSQEDHVSTTPLARPEVSIVGGDSQATLSWQAVTGASKYEIFSYDDGTYEYLAETTELSYTFSSLTNGVRYDYSVRAVSDTSYSTRSSKLLASVIPVSAPQVSIMGYTGKIKLTWDAVEGASAYRICVYDESTGDYVRVDGTKETSYIVYGLTNGQEYTYIVRAYTGISWSADEVAVSTTPLARPEVSIVGGDSQATLSWDAVPGASKYEIFSYDDGTYEYLAETTELSYTFSSLTNGVRYDYSVRAVSDTSYSTRSSKLLASVIPVSAPQVSIIGYTGKIKLTWDAVEGASAYRICVYDESTGDYVRVDGTKETSYVVYGLTDGQEYTYIVRAYTGISWSADEVAVSATPLARPEVSIIGGDEQATLSWQAVTGASKYEIFSYDDGVYEYLAETTELSYTFSELTNGVRYDYSVRAVSDTAYSTRSSKLLASVIPSAE